MNEVATCLITGKTEHETPLVSMRYRGKAFWVATECMPVVIHNPERIADKLSGIGFDASGESRD